MLATKLFSPQDFLKVHEKWHYCTWRLSWHLPPAPRSHTEYTPSFGQRILNIISTDHRFWSSMCTCNWLLKGFSEQNSLRYYKFSTHKSCMPHLLCKPQIWPHHSLAHYFIFTKSLFTLGSNAEKDESSFLAEFPECLWNISGCIFNFSPL